MWKIARDEVMEDFEDGLASEMRRGDGTENRFLFGMLAQSTCGLVQGRGSARIPYFPLHKKTGGVLFVLFLESVLFAASLARQSHLCLAFFSGLYALDR